MRCLDAGLPTLNKEIKALQTLIEQKAANSKWLRRRSSRWFATFNKILDRRMEALRLAIEIICAQLAYCLTRSQPHNWDDEDAIDGFIFFLKFRTLLGRRVFPNKLATCAELLRFLGVDK